MILRGGKKKRWVWVAGVIKAMLAVNIRIGGATEAKTRLEKDRQDRQGWKYGIAAVSYSTITDRQAGIATAQNKTNKPKSPPLMGDG